MQKRIKTSVFIRVRLWLKNLVKNFNTTFKLKAE